MVTAGHAARRIVWCVALAAAFLAAPSSTAQESASFRMERITTTASAGYADSASFETRVVVSQESPSGSMASMCGEGWINTAGFFSILGNGAVPIWLTVERTSIDPLEIALSWTGTEDSFEVRRSFDPDTIHDPGGLLETVGVCASVDPLPIASDLIYYLVVAAPTDP